VKNRKREAFAAASIFIGAAVLVVWIRGGFDPVPSQAENLQQVCDPPDARLLSELTTYNSGDITPQMALMLMLLGKTGPFSLPGIVDPPVESAEATTAPVEAKVIGVSINGQSRAYCVSEMGTPFTHVINDVIDQIPVTVTYCDRTGCARVFTKADDLLGPLDVGVGGFSGGQLVLHVEHQNFAQNSRDIPLQDLEFETTTWGQWRSKHPGSDICTKPAASSGEAARSAALDDVLRFNGEAGE
jgi:hypothetical protein